MKTKKVALLPILITIWLIISSGCAALQKPPTWPEYQKEIGFQERPSREIYGGPDLSFMKDKLEPPSAVFLDVSGKIVDPKFATYIAYTIKEHDKIVEAVKRKKFAENAVELLAESNKLKHEIIQDLKQELWLTEKQAAIESWMRKVEGINHEKDTLFYKVKDVIIGVGAAAIFVLSVAP